MGWIFNRPETVTPEYQPDESMTTDGRIIETAFDGCCWCGTGEGCCSAHMAELLAQSAERAAARRRGGDRDE